MIRPRHAKACLRAYVGSEGLIWVYTEFKGLSVLILRVIEAVLTSTNNLFFFLSGNKKNNVYPCKPQFYCIKVGFKGVKIISACFRDGEQMSGSDCAFVKWIWWVFCACSKTHLTHEECFAWRGPIRVDFTNILSSYLRVLKRLEDFQ